MNRFYKAFNLAWILIAFGILMLMASVLNWDLFLLSSRKEWLILRFGRRAYQISNAMFGIFMIAIGIFFLRGRKRQP